MVFGRGSLDLTDTEADSLISSLLLKISFSGAFRMSYWTGDVESGTVKEDKNFNFIFIYTDVSVCPEYK